MASPRPPDPVLARALAARLGARLIETHISWVLLWDGQALKLKRPVRLPFVDYASLEARRRCCEEELRLNRRLAPGLYLGVARITGTMAQPRLDGPGEAIEYGVRMARFPDGALFSERLAAGTLSTAEVDTAARRLAEFHAAAPAARPSDPQGGDPGRRRAVALAALDGAAPALAPTEQAEARAWLLREAGRLQAPWAARLAQGRVREGHGDLHLANLLALPDGDAAAFDGIEFEPALRWIDVADDIAFPVMDLEAWGRRDLAFRLLDRWLEHTGDHGALTVLRFALVYRALVRAQVEGLQGHADAARRYAEAALRWMQPPAPRLAITHGLPGSGKSRAAAAWLEREGGVRFRSDVERKRLFGLGPQQDSRAAGLDIYTAEAGARTYGRLADLAREALSAGWPVVLDAAFLRRAERDAAQALARGCGVPFAILHCEAPGTVLRERVRARRGDASEADEQVLARLQATEEPLAAEEMRWVAAAG